MKLKAGDVVVWQLPTGEWGIAIAVGEYYPYRNKKGGLEKIEIDPEVANDWEAKPIMLMTTAWLTKIGRL
jgi:hypothetical protein